QFTPPGSPASVIFGNNVTAAAPGSAKGHYLVVSDIEAARKHLVAHGAEVGEIFHGAGEEHVGADEAYLFGSKRVNGSDPARGSYSSFLS
ncbi:glyoxalase, partial [Acinetobacter baumannii]